MLALALFAAGESAAATLRYAVVVGDGAEATALVEALHLSAGFERAGPRTVLTSSSGLDAAIQEMEKRISRDKDEIAGVQSLLAVIRPGDDALGKYRVPQERSAKVFFAASGLPRGRYLLVYDEDLPAAVIVKGIEPLSFDAYPGRARLIPIDRPGMVLDLELGATAPPYTFGLAYGYAVFSDRANAPRHSLQLKVGIDFGALSLAARVGYGWRTLLLLETAEEDRLNAFGGGVLAGVTTTIGDSKVAVRLGTEAWWSKEAVFLGFGGFELSYQLYGRLYVFLEVEAGVISKPFGAWGRGGIGPMISF
jgi:hypothetical protein